MGRRVAVRPRLIHDWVEDLVEVGTLKMILEEDLVAGGILVHFEQVSCRTGQVEVREEVDMREVVHLEAVGA